MRTVARAQPARLPQPRPVHRLLRHGRRSFPRSSSPPPSSACLPDTAPLRFQLATFFDRILPPDVSPLLAELLRRPAHNSPQIHPRPHRRRPRQHHRSLQRHRHADGRLSPRQRSASRLLDLLAAPPPRSSPRAALADPLHRSPASSSSSASSSPSGSRCTSSPFARTPILVVALLLRWTIALIGSIGIIGLIYHMGTPHAPAVLETLLPGAVVATACGSSPRSPSAGTSRASPTTPRSTAPSAPASPSSSGSTSSPSACSAARSSTPSSTPVCPSPHVPAFHRHLPQNSLAARLELASAVQTHWSYHP